MKPSHRMLVALLSDVIVAMNVFNVNLYLVSKTFCRILLSRVFSVGYMPLRCTTLRAFSFKFPCLLPDVQLRSYSFTACEHRNTAHPVDVPLKKMLPNLRPSALSRSPQPFAIQGRRVTRSTRSLIHIRILVRILSSSCFRLQALKHAALLPQSKSETIGY